MVEKGGALQNLGKTDYPMKLRETFVQNNCNQTSANEINKLLQTPDTRLFLIFIYMKFRKKKLCVSLCSSELFMPFCSVFWLKLRELLQFSWLTIWSYTDQENKKLCITETSYSNEKIFFQKSIINLSKCFHHRKRKFQLALGPYTKTRKEQVSQCFWKKTFRRAATNLSFLLYPSIPSPWL